MYHKLLATLKTAPDSDNEEEDESEEGSDEDELEEDSDGPEEERETGDEGNAPESGREIMVFMSSWGWGCYNVDHHHLIPPPHTHTY